MEYDPKPSFFMREGVLRPACGSFASNDLPAVSKMRTHSRLPDTNELESSLISKLRDIPGEQLASLGQCHF
jgi:hypothetical protein